MLDPFDVRAAVVASALFCAAGGCAANPRDMGGGPDPVAVRATLALDLRNPESARETFFGDVLLIVLPRQGIAALLDGGPGPGMQDGYVDQVFVLQQEQTPVLRPRMITGTELHYAGRTLFIRDAAGAPLLLSVVASSDAIGSVPALEVAAATRYEGFGLARRTGAWSVRLARAEEALDELLPIAR